MLEGIYEELGMTNTYDVWYETLNRKLKKRKSFTTISDLTKWLKANQNKIRITSGSLQAFDIMDELKGIKKVSSENDAVWKFGKPS